MSFSPKAAAERIIRDLTPGASDIERGYVLLACRYLEAIKLLTEITKPMDTDGCVDFVENVKKFLPEHDEEKE